MNNNIKLALVAVAVAVAGVFAGTYTPAEATGSRCLDPNNQSSYEAGIPTRNRGTISTRDGRPLCSDGTLVFQSFNIPDTWNKLGWNATAIPQTKYAAKTFVFPAGKWNHSITLDIASPEACKHTQVDFYIAPGYESITTLDGDDERNIIGILFPATEKCEQPKPKEIQVCVLSDKTIKTIYEANFDSTKHSKNLDDCKVVPVPETMKVCVLSDKTIKTIDKKDFDSSKHSKNLDDCKVVPKPEMIKVCVLQDKSIKTIDKKDFDSSKYSKDLNDCKVTPKPELLEVCILDSKTIKTIDKKDSSSSKHSKDLNNCTVTPAPKGDDTPVAMPSTGIENILSGIIGTSSLASAGYYYVNSRRRLHM